MPIFNQDWNTILFGSGIGNTSKIFYGKYVNDRFYPHNILVEILGESGKHSRSAVSAASLPLGVAVEIEGIFEIN